MKKYFKVKYGFDTQSAVTVEEGGELDKVVYAWKEGLPVSIGNKMIQGKYIISIEPDYHRYTGWNEGYSPSNSDDFAQIRRDCPDFTGVLEESKQRIAQLEAKGKQHLIGTNNVKKING